MIEYRQYRHFLTYHFSNHTNNTANSSSVHIKNSTNTTLQKLKQSVSEMQPIVLLALCLAGVLLITIIVVICCRKYHTRHLYQQSPQNFSSKPNLSLPQLWRIQQKVISKTLPDGQSIVPKETYDGKFIEVAFKTHRNCIYFPVQQTSDCYFEIQIIKLSSVVQIGFVHKDDINSICKEISKGEYQIDFDQYGISVRTDGVTIAYGTNHMNFDWKIEYGDTIGIGLTKHEGFGRVWITRNGIIQNPPSQQQRIKFIDVKSEGKQHITMKKTKNEEDEQEENERQKKEELLAAKRKIEIKIARKFCFYAVIVSESPSNPKRQTILNWNVGGQNFRLYDATTLGGLLG